MKPESQVSSNQLEETFATEKNPPILLEIRKLFVPKCSINFEDLRLLLIEFKKFEQNLNMLMILNLKLVLLQILISNVIYKHEEHSLNLHLLEGISVAFTSAFGLQKINSALQELFFLKKNHKTAMSWVDG